MPNTQVPIRANSAKIFEAKSQGTMWSKIASSFFNYIEIKALPKRNFSKSFFFEKNRAISRRF